MIIQLGVENVALIKKLNIDFSCGMTVLTGETGAGKSIIIDSINMILGDRTKKELVRSGEDKAKVQAVFDVDDELSGELSGDGIEIEENQLIISREVTSDGKSVCRINGTVVTLSYLRDIASRLVNIHGQHDNQALLNPKKHIDFIDCFGKIDKSDYISEYENYRNILKRIEKLYADESERMKRLDLLRYQATELKGANIKSGEEDELKAERDIIANAESIAQATATAYAGLYGDSDGVSAYDALSISVKALEEISECPGVKEILESLNNAMYSIEEAAHEVSSLADGVEYDEQVLSDIELRLGVISNMKRKYGGSEDDIIEYFKSISEELSQLENSDELLDELNIELKESENRLLALAKNLTSKREKSAKEIESQIRLALSELDMGSCQFEVKLKKTESFTQSGVDTAEFFISTNAGEAPRELSKIASGGELSRVMLAMKSVLADSDNVDTLIFDEIDTGVSGNAAKKIAVKLGAIGNSKQVICISHLARIAAQADTHLLIKKGEVDGRTETSLTKLTTDERCRELARITDGDITDVSLAHAKEMLVLTGKFME